MSQAWTHTMAYDDVRAMLAVASDGMSVDMWRTQIGSTARLLASDRRARQVRLALTILRPQGAVLHDDGFLSDLAAADSSGVRDLIYARYLSSVPLAVHIARSLFHPARVRDEREIPRGALTQAVEEALGTCSAGTRRRSLNAITSEFARAGIVRVEKTGPVELTFRQPATLAIFHLLRDDLHERQEASDDWLAASSLAAILFALPPEVMRTQIDKLVVMGRLRRSYYSGEPRILAA